MELRSLLGFKSRARFPSSTPFALLFIWGSPYSKPNFRQKGTVIIILVIVIIIIIIIKGLLENLERLTVQGLEVRRGFGLGGFKFEGSRGVKKLQQEILGWASGLGRAPMSRRVLARPLGSLHPKP